MKKRTTNLPLDDHYAGVLYSILEYYTSQIDDELETLDENSLAADLLNSRMSNAMDLLKAVEEIQPTYWKLAIKSEDFNGETIQ
jgi:hypothetical protein